VEPELGSANLPEEVMKAQLVASRSYLLAVHDRHPGKVYDFCDSPHCQVFRGVPANTSALQHASEACRREYLTFRGKPAAAFFHHSCGGMTASIEDVWPGAKIPYLQRVQDGPANRAYCRKGMLAFWAVKKDIAWMKKALVRAKLMKQEETLEKLEVVRMDKSGRAHEILIEGTRQHWVSAAAVRVAINRQADKEIVYSLMFKVSRQGSLFVIKGRGWGHGVGLCQEGAIEMAREGKTYREILNHYYPGTKIDQLNDISRR
jgi:stage II sporulation protein D